MYSERVIFVIDFMKKTSVKIVISVVNILSLLALVLVVFLNVFVNKYGYKEKAFGEGLKLILENVAVDIHNEIYNGDMAELVERYRETNVEFAVFLTFDRALGKEELLGGMNVDKAIVTNAKQGDIWYGGTMFSMRKNDVYVGESIDNLYVIFSEHLNKVESSVEWNGEYYNVVCRVPGMMNEDDVISDWDQFVEKSYVAKTYYVPLVVLFSVLFFASLILLVLFTGESKKGKINLCKIDKIPLEFLTVGVVLFEVLLGVGIHIVLYQGMNTILLVPIQVLMAIIFLVYILSVSRRVKKRKIFRYSALRVISGPIDKMVYDMKKSPSLFIRVILILTILTLLEGAVLYYFNGGSGLLLVFFAIYKVFEYVFVLYISYEIWNMEQCVTKIISGDIDAKIDTTKFRGDLKRQAEKINEVGNSIEESVKERMKSERMKTELITNVSHDIKTPLTSVINYVDLLKKEDLKDENVNEYINVLERQSARLKKLIDDLIEASKASTGNLDVNMEPCNINVLLAQVLGEAEKQCADAKLDIVVSGLNQDVIALADGRHLWRVFDNLVGNICKYSLENTRVYIDVYQRDENVIIEFKNISKTKLNISPDELMERFVRGDASRTTEGSGLGLSIARSLTELMNGRMNIEIDGDLFKVKLTFGK